MMRKSNLLFLFAILVLFLSACAKKNVYTTPDYSDHTDPSESRYVTQFVDLSQLSEDTTHLATHMFAENWKRELSELQKDDIWGYDFRSCDVSQVDLDLFDDFNDISFDSATIWPDTLPDGLAPEDILEYNKNPGLSVRKIHEQGITGQGVGIAIIDQGLYTEHTEYADNLKSYELIHCGDTTAQMHGAAVASIAVGHTVGVAPNADLYYIASTYGHFSEDRFEFDGSVVADCILRVCEMNKHLSPERRIRVISISRGYSENDFGYAELQAAIKEADRQGILVLTTSTGQFYDFDLMGLHRSYFDDPDDPFSYRPANWLNESLDLSASNFVFVPCGSRTYASCTGPQNYEICYSGGMSWAVPWTAGLYALCCQVKPDITPNEFVCLIKDASYNEKEIHIVDPCSIISSLQEN